MFSCLLRRYGESTLLELALLEPDGVNLKADAAFAVGDVTISLDGGAESNVVNLPNGAGRGYALALAAVELQAARIVVYVVDQTDPKTRRDQVLIVETYGHAEAQHRFELGASVGGSSGSGDYLADLAAARANIARQLAEMTASPKPSYQIDGQQVSWSEHFQALSGELARLTAELQAAEPFEIHSSGYTG